MKRPDRADEVTCKLKRVTHSDQGSYSLKLADEVTREMKSQPHSHAKNIRSQVMHYETWLSMQTKRSTLTTTLHEMNEYAESAEKTALVGDRKVHIFAPFRTEHSALWVANAARYLHVHYGSLLWSLHDDHRAVMLDTAAFNRRRD